jgi:hypothetical protein
VLRRVFEPNRDEVTGEWRRLHIEEPYDLYCSPNISRVDTQRRMRCVGHVVVRRRGRCLQGIGGVA